MTKQKIILTNVGFLPESPGGTEYYTLNLAQALLARGYDVLVIAALDDGRRKRYQVVPSEFEGVRAIKIVNSPFLARSYQEFFVDPAIDQIFKEILTEEKPDLIHFQHLAYLSGNLPEIAKEMGIPCLATLHDYWYLCYRTRLMRPSCGICSGPEGGVHCASCDDGVTPHPMSVSKYPQLVQFLRRPKIRQYVAQTSKLIPQDLVSKSRTMLFQGNRNHQEVLAKPDPTTVSQNQFRHDYFRRQLQHPVQVLSPSEHLKHRYEQEGYRHIDVVPLGFEPTETLPALPYTAHTDKLRLAFVGVIEPHKGVQIVLQALASQPQLTDKLELHIHGHAKDILFQAELETLAQTLPKESVHFHGRYRSDQDLKRIFGQVHAVLFPSLWEENYPLVVREALLHGRPVIAANLGGVPEVIENGVNGLLFDPLQPEDFISAIYSLIDQPSLLETLTIGAGHTKIETQTDHLNKLIALYEKALDTSKTPSSQVVTQTSTY
ncbi:MAG: glycosyltransferase [Chloroflexota bacterium]